MSVQISPSALQGEFAVPRPTREQVERLQRAKQVLLNRVADPATKGVFEMSVWYDPHSPAEGCQTAACAAGWCALDPVLMSQGFHLTTDTRPGHAWPEYQRQQGLNACKQFFGCDGVFDPYNYQPAEAVGKGRGMVAGEEVKVHEEDVVHAIEQQLMAWGVLTDQNTTFVL